MDFAVGIMGKLPMLNPEHSGIPFLRHGREVELLPVNSDEECMKWIIRDIEKQKKQGYVTFALICKNQEQARDYHKLFQKSYDPIQLITEDNTYYKGGVSILPTYLSKGMEFDCVYVIGADEENYRIDELDGKLLYVAVTRALHNLTLFWREDKQLSALIPV